VPAPRASLDDPAWPLHLRRPPAEVRRLSRPRSLSLRGEDPVTKRCQVVGIGNAIVDVLTQCDDDFLDWMGIEKGIMQLVDRERGETLYAAMKERTQARSEERRVGRGGGGRGRPHEGGSEGQVEGEQRRKNTR